MADIFEIVGKVSLDGLDKAEKDLKGFGDTGEQSASKLSKLGSIAGAVGKGVLIGTGAVATGAVALVKSVSGAYGQLQQSIGGIETLFGDSAQKVIENANNAYTTAGISANEYMQQVTSFSASLLQSLGGDTESAANAADMAVRDMADNANKMGTSMEMIQNAYQGFSKQNYTMLDNLKLGYGGTKTEMERLLADAEKISGVKYDISNLNDVYSAIHVVQQELGITGTTALEAGETIEGSFNSLSASWENFIAGLGNPDADMGQLVDNLAKGLSGAINNVIPIINNMVSVLPTVMDAIIGAVNDLAPTFITTFTTLITQVIDAIVKLLPTIIPLIVDTLRSVINTLVENLPLIIDAVILLVTEVIKALSEMLPTLIPTIVQAVVDIANSLIENLPTLLNAVLQLVLGIADGLIQALPILIEALPQIIDGIVNFLIENIPTLLNGAIQLFMALVEAIPTICVALLQAIPKIIVSILKGLASLPSKLKKFFTNIWKSIKGVFAGVGTWFKSKFSSAWESVKSVFSAWGKFFTGLWDKIKSIFSKVGTWFKSIFSSAWTAIKGVFSGWGTFFSGMWTSIKNTFGGVGSWFKSKFSSAWTAIKNVFSNWGSFFSGLWTKIKSTFSSLGTKLGDAIGGSVKSGINGVLGMIENVINKGIGMINGAIGLINKIPGVEIGTFETVSLPRLAKGGVVNKPTVAEIGEDGDEAVIPIENNLGWIKNLAEELKSVILPNIKGIENIINTTPMQHYQVAFNTQFNALNDRVEQLISLISEYLPNIADNMDRNIVLDGNSLVVGMSRKIDNQLGRMATAKGRGNV